jgi:catechol 2,3-dioxygenase-like lactoylglutathione lyase family enzyme
VSIDLDHVAIATRDVTQIVNTLVGDLGSRVLFGGINFGFRAMQLDCGDLRIELLEPHNIEQNDFLERFLVRNGEGPHHLTFKTDDIVGLLGRIEEADVRPVGVNLDNPWWREAFIHPKDAWGTVVQVAQSDFSPEVLDREEREYGPGRWWDDPPEPDPDKRAVLKRVVVTTDEFQKTLALYADILGGERVGWDEGFVELGWPGGGRIRVEVAAGREQGIDRIEWEAPHTGGATDERTVGGARFVLYPSSSVSS